MNVFSVRLVAFLNDVSVWWHVAGVVIIVGFLIFKPDHHQSFHTVFTKTINNSGFSHAMAVVRAAARALAGAVHVHGLRRLGAHERGDGERVAFGGARASIMSIVVSAIFGYILALGVTFAIQNLTDTTGAGTFAVKEILLQSLGDSTAKVMLFIIVMAQLFCGMSSITVGLANGLRVLARPGDAGTPALAPAEPRACAVPRSRCDRDARVPLRVPGVLRHATAPSPTLR